MGFRSTLIVEMADGETHNVVIDQRDLAAAEADPNGSGERIFTRIRFLAWHAAKRSGQYAGTFQTFNGKDCIDVEGEEDPKAESNA